MLRLQHSNAVQQPEDAKHTGPVCQYMNRALARYCPVELWVVILFAPLKYQQVVLTLQPARHRHASIMFSGLDQVPISAFPTLVVAQRQTVLELS